MPKTDAQPRRERPGPPAPTRGPDWEAFYRDFRKPGYIPGYRIGAKLGGGVFGIVFKARKESIGKPYAIKFLKVDEEGAGERIRRELEQIKLFARIDHPNLVGIEDQGIVDGIPYIVMGFAGEETLADRLAEGPLPEREALALFVQVLRGVRALHAHGLAHFDLKPANIFLKGGVARVGDYGLAKLLRESRASLSCGRGTPYYMAPEILRRKGDHRADLYSLGAILFECLCGRPPFTGETEWEVLRAHEREALRVPDAVRPPLSRILERLLAKDPAARYQEADEVLADLRRAAPEAFAPLPPPRPEAPARARGAARPARPEAPARSATARAGAPRPPAMAEQAGRERAPGERAPANEVRRRPRIWLWWAFGLFFLPFVLAPRAPGRAVGPRFLLAGALVAAFLVLRSRRPDARSAQAWAGFLAFLLLSGLTVLLLTFLSLSGPGRFALGFVPCAPWRFPW